MSIRSFCERIGSNMNRSEKETIEGNISEINRLKNITVYEENLYVKAILDLGTSLGSITFGTRFLTNVDSVYTNFKISAKNEIIIATIRKSIVGGLLSKEQVVITDHAIYSSGKEKNRFPLEELSRYVVINDKSNNTYLLDSQEEQFCILGAALIARSKSEAHKDILRIIKIFQRIAIENTDSGKKDRENLSAWVIGIVDKEKADGKLSDNTMLMLESMLETDRELCDKLSPCLLGYAISTCNIQIIEESIYKLLNIIDAQNKDKLAEWCKKELNTYSNRIKNPTIILKDNYIRIVCENICKSKESECNIKILEECAAKEIIEDIFAEFSIIKPYLIARKDMECTVTELCSKNGIDNATNKKYEDFIKFAVAYKNYKMAEIFQNIRDNNKLPDNCYKWVDGFGLDVLHYSIILHNHDMIQYLCDNVKTERHFQGNKEKSRLNLYEYGTIAALVGEEREINKLVLLSEEMQPLIANKSQLQVLLKLKNASLYVSEKALHRAEEIYRNARRMDGINEYKLDDYKYKIENLKDKIYTYKEDIQELENDILDVEEEIKSCSEYLRKQYYKNAENIRNARPSLEWFFNQLFLNTDSMYNTLNCGLYDGNIFVIDGVIYFIPMEYARKIIDEGNAREKRTSENYQRTRTDNKQDHRNEYRKHEYQNQQKNRDQQFQKEQGNLKFDKPYGNHWFSDEAYKDIKVMRTEYRKLVVKYHPDNNPDGIEAFKDIQEEKNIILKKLSDENK